MVRLTNRANLLLVRKKNHGICYSCYKIQQLKAVWVQDQNLSRSTSKTTVWVREIMLARISKAPFPLFTKTKAAIHPFWDPALLSSLAHR